MEKTKRRNYPSPVLAPSERRQWVDRLETELFPHQESEFEQESFTPTGRKRVDQFLRRFEAEIKFRLLRGAR
jgi:hypothetical protein